VTGEPQPPSTPPTLTGEPETPSIPPAVAAAERSTLPGRHPSPLPPLVLDAPPPAGMRTALWAGAAMTRQRLLRRPSVLLAVLGLALAVVGALIERRAGEAGAVDRALAGTFRLVIPLVTFGVVGMATGRGRLREAAWPAARFGLSRRDVTLGIVAATCAAAAALGALLALVSVVSAYAPGGEPLVSDALISAFVGALTGAAYAGWLAFGSTFFRRGGGLWAVLAADFLLGASTGPAGAVFPRGHAQNLLGGAPPLGLPQPASTAALLAIAIVLGLAAALRSRD
jgi:hypothetical protein